MLDNAKYYNINILNRVCKSLASLFAVFFSILFNIVQNASVRSNFYVFTACYFNNLSS